MKSAFLVKFPEVAHLSDSWASFLSEFPEVAQLAQLFFHWFAAPRLPSLRDISAALLNEFPKRTPLRGSRYAPSHFTSVFGRIFNGGHICRFFYFFRRFCLKTIKL